MRFGLSYLDAPAAFLHSSSTKKHKAQGISHHLGERTREQHTKAFRKKGNSTFREILKEEIKKVKREMD